ncbi:Phosphoglycerol transferase and related proteins, alkaline phosphatase superfamily [Kingella potus]|uniref:Phosphoglycerol transferase and related proteins, alkaline phosphatase superfamily n=1 Tax=Kingella potus TaxID=265175 RepID=A0A377QXF6_9NEIS|nr:LTA synthase family protein [Kingella potus]STQ99883.1 Phosphoglycerol transferase and related proteins, alkaline phosphatase superfamily [Kingella potus]
MHYILLALFAAAALAVGGKAHYRWTRFFAACQFVFFSGLMFAACGQWQRALNFACVLFVVLILFHRLKIHYYKQPLLVSDFLLAFDWRNWETLTHYKGAIAAVAGLVGILAYALFGWSGAAVADGIWRILAAAAAAAALLLMVRYTKDKRAVQVWLDSLPDDGRDVFLNLPMSCRSIFFKTPEFDGDGERFRQLAAEQRPSETEQDGADRPDIVVCLQESTFNPHNIALQSHNLPPMPMFDPQPDTRFAAPLRVHTFGGGTWKSEFALLAGVPSTDFGAQASGVFYSVVPHLRGGLVQNLKAHGYYCVALSPFTKGNYNAKAAYDHFGFDLVLQPQELGYPAPLSKNLWHIGSGEMLYYAQMILEKRHPALEQIAQPLFVYVLTMKEHGPYRSDTPNRYGLVSDGLSDKAVGSLNDYAARIADLNLATEDFNQWLQRRAAGVAAAPDAAQNGFQTASPSQSRTPPRDYVFAYFGDHQPNFEHFSLPVQSGFAHPEYLTQCAVRSSLRHTPPPHGLLDLALFGSVVLETAGLEAKDGLMQANAAIRRLADGRLEDCPDRRLVGDYRDYLYRHLKITG